MTSSTALISESALPAADAIPAVSVTYLPEKRASAVSSTGNPICRFADLRACSTGGRRAHVVGAHLVPGALRARRRAIGARRVRVGGARVVRAEVEVRVARGHARRPVAGHGAVRGRGAREAIGAARLRRRVDHAGGHRRRPALAVARVAGDAAAQRAWVGDVVAGGHAVGGRRRASGARRGAARAGAGVGHANSGAAMEPGLACGAARVGRARGHGVRVGGRLARHATARQRPALHDVVVGEAPAGGRAHVRAGAADHAARCVRARGARRARRAIDAVHGPARQRRVVADAHAVA